MPAFAYHRHRQCAHFARQTCDHCRSRSCAFESKLKVIVKKVTSPLIVYLVADGFGSVS